MALTQELIERIACPGDHGQLQPVNASTVVELAEATALKCDKCLAVYRIDNGILVLLATEATTS